MAVQKTKIKKNDTVQVMTGKDKGKSGRVLRVDKYNGRVLVEGVNMAKKAIKPRRENEKSGITDIEAALSLSNIMIVCKKCGPTRVGYKLEGEEKKRICKKCGEEL